MLMPAKAFASLDAKVLPASRREAERLQARETTLAQAEVLNHQARQKLLTNLPANVSIRTIHY